MYDLYKSGASASEIAHQARVVAAITGQTFMFTTSRFLINGLIAQGLIGLIKDLYDDDEGKLAELQVSLDKAHKEGDPIKIANAENELRNAKVIRDVTGNMMRNTNTFDSFWKNVVREELGAVHVMFDGPALLRMPVFGLWDSIAKRNQQLAMKQRTDEMSKQVAELRKQGKYGQAARLMEDMEILKSAEYIPLNYENNQNKIGLSGLTGASAFQIYDTIDKFNKQVAAVKPYNWSDFILSMQSMGVGQADVTKFLKAISKIEDKRFENDKRYKEETLPKAEADKAGKRQSKIRSMIREQLGIPSIRPQPDYSIYGEES